MPIKLGQHAYTFGRVGTKGLWCRYLLYLPNGYLKRRRYRWPLLLFLHGSGECGDDPEMVRRHGPPRRCDERDDLPFIVLSPQSARDDHWSLPVLDAVLNHVLRRYRVDEERIALTGLSFGGYGAWSMGIKHPDRFCCIAPVCGGGDPERVGVLQHVPVWVFHGENDGNVPIEESQVMVDALRTAGGDVRFTVYTDAEHGVWTTTYANPELYDWFLRHRRPQPTLATTTA
jgi:predicted peptidase